jgi:hypothetical protein
MAAGTFEPLRLEPSPPRPSRATGRRVYLGVVLAVALAATLGALASRPGGARGVRSLPPEQRAALLARTVDELRQSCADGHAPALDDHCRELASFAVRFDECRGECAAIVRPFIVPGPTR